MLMGQASYLDIVKQLDKVHTELNGLKILLESRYGGQFNDGNKLILETVQNNISEASDRISGIQYFMDGMLEEGLKKKETGS